MHTVHDFWEELHSRQHYFPDDIPPDLATWFAINHIGSDLVTGGASLAICLAGIYLVYRSKAHPRLRWFYLLVAAMFGISGFKLLSEITLAGHHSHGLIAVANLGNAVARVVLAVTVWVGFPQVLRLKLPEELEREQALREMAERELATANEALEEDVQARTAALEQAMKSMVQEVQRRRESEEKLKHLSETLDMRVKLRTEDLQALNRELDEFASAVSHDLRGPLRAINSFAWLLDDEYGDRLQEDAANYLAEIKKGTQRMDELITTLFNHSRNSRAPITRQNVDISRMAREKLNEYHLLDHDRDVHVTVDEGITVYADPSLVEVVMDNILSNAWKYTSKREVGRIHVFAQVTRQATWVHVSDNGAGFDMSRAAELFQPFKRLHTAAEFPGTGVGLSTVRRILSRHGGRIEFSSTPGMGSTFWFNFGDYT